MNQKQKNLAIGGGIAVFILVMIITIVSTKIGVTNTGNKKEAALNAQYQDNENYLSDCVTQIRETANVATAKSDKLGVVLVDAVKGRYDSGSSASGVGRGQLFSALKEAYPDLKDVGNLYDRVFTKIEGCRTDYRGVQSKLLSMLNSYDSWRTGSWKVRTFGGGYPSNNLVARIGTQSFHGQQAYDQMHLIVVVGDVNKDYTTGTLVPEQPFGGNATTTTGG